MYKKQNLIRDINGCRQRIYMGLVMMLILIGTTINVTAQTCVQTLAGSGVINSGAGNPSMSVTLSPTCQGQGVITGITMDGVVGGGCGISFESRVYVNGVLVPHPGSPGFGNCGFTGYDLTSYLPITSVTYEVYTFNFTNVTVSFSMNLNVTYSANFCTGVPSAGNVVVSTPVICAGDTVDLSLSGQTAALGLEYQWQSSLDNSMWTDMIDDTLLYASTTLNNTSYFRCVTTCAYSGLSDTSSIDSVYLGFCTPFSDTSCSYNAGPSVVNVSITGWQGMPLSDGILTFNYKGNLNQAGNFLTVTDALGNVYGQLDGSQLFCGDFTSELPISLSQISSLLTAGNGSIDLIVTSTSGVGAYCPTSTQNASFCITASLRAATEILPNDARSGALITPAPNSCVLGSNVSFLLENTGSSPLTSAQLNWSVNGVAQAMVNWTGNIASFTSDTVSLGQYLGGFSNYDTLNIWPTMPNAVPDSNSVGDTLNVVLHNALNGTYSINPDGTGDFYSFTEVMFTLESYGVCGPVIFEVADSTYPEQISINTSQIGGVDSANSITFISPNGPATLVYLATTNADNYVVSFNNSKYVTFANLEFKNIGSNYSRVIISETGGENQHITFSNCLFQGVPSSTSTSNAVCYIRGANNHNWQFLNNTFLNGSYGLYFGTSSQNLSIGDSNSIIGNEFLEQRNTGIYFQHQSNPTVKDNHFNANPLSNFTSSYAMSISYLDGDIEISGNHVEGSDFWPKYGIYVGTCEGSDLAPAKIFNNRFYLPSINSTRGMYIYNLTNGYVVHNSIYKNGGIGTNNLGLQLLNCDSVVVQNNIVQLKGAGFGMYISGNAGASINSDYNCVNVIDTTGFTGYFNGDTTLTLADWTLATTFDSNSIAVSTIYSDTSSLLVCADSLYGAGNYLPSYPMDFQGDPRQNPSCIGADEFMPLSYVILPNEVELCDGDTLELSQYYYDVVVWDILDTSNTISFTTPGSHSQYVSGECGTNTSSFDIIAQELAFVKDTNLCEGTSALLNTGISNGTYLWSDGSTDSVLAVNSAQTVTVFVTSEFGCTSEDTAFVTQSVNVKFDMDTNSFCEGSNVVLDANMLGVYSWSDGSSNQTLNVTTPGIYSVTVVETNCTSFDSIYVKEVLNPVVSFTESVNVNTVTFTNTSLYADNYNWDFGDGNTSISENPVHTYSPTTNDWTYTVTLNASNDCDNDDFIMEVTSKPNSISDVDLAKHVKIYPNPANNKINLQIESGNTGSLEVLIMDTKGMVHYQSNDSSFQGVLNQDIDISMFSSGIYLVKIMVNEEVAIFKLIKE